MKTSMSSVAQALKDLVGMHPPALDVRYIVRRGYYNKQVLQ